MVSSGFFRGSGEMSYVEGLCESYRLATQSQALGPAAGHHLELVGTQISERSGLAFQQDSGWCLHTVKSEVLGLFSAE